MLSQNLVNLAKALGEVAVETPERIGYRLDRIRDNLFDLASQVKQLEVHFTRDLRKEKDDDGA